MTVTQRKPQHLPEEVQTVNEPGVQYQCDACSCDLTHTVRIKCADPVCESEEGVDICPACFCAGKEFANHKRGHPYRVIEISSYPIFTEDWGADEELLLLTGIVSQGIGNWKKIAEHVGTRTKEEVEKHYNEVYVDSPHWPLPIMDRQFDVDPDEFQDRKRRRISAMNAIAPPPPTVAPTSAPGIHEIATYLPGRLEFEHELDNEAEDLVKDLEFGITMQYGGDEIPEDEEDLDMKARKKWIEERKLAATGVPNGVVPTMRGKSVGKGPMMGRVNGKTNGHRETPKPEAVPKTEENGTVNGEEEEEPTQPPPTETEESLAFKLTLMEMYAQRIERRAEGKGFIFNRGLLDYKKMQANEKKRSREDREFLNRLRPFAKLQTAEDYEAFAADMLYEVILRKNIQDLQVYRRLGLSTASDIDKYTADLAKRTQAKATAPRDHDRFHSRAGSRFSVGPDARASVERETTPRLPGTGPPPASAPPVRRQPAPLNLANSPSLHLLTPAEQTLCSQLRILPKPYLAIKETLVREYARRGGKLRRREARDLVKIDVNKTSRVWDFLVQAGFLKITQEPQPSATASGSGSAAPSLNGSPVKEAPRSVPMTATSSVTSQPGSVHSMNTTPNLPPAIPSWPR